MEITGAAGNLAHFSKHNMTFNAILGESKELNPFLS